MMDSPLIAGPIQRYQKFKSTLDNAQGQLAQFVDGVKEISGDPFVQKPAEALLSALNHVESAQAEILRAMEALKPFATKLGADNGSGRPSVATVIDESVRE